jgi:Sulfatase-modifying factor enzyme 1
MALQLKRNKIIAIIVIGLLVLCLIFLLFTAGKRRKVTAMPAATTASVQNGQKVTGIVSSDSMGRVLPQTMRPVFPHAAHVRTAPPETTEMRAGAIIDTSESGGPEEDTAADTTEFESVEGAMPGCAGDTVKPWVYPDPSGGLHRKPITVTFVSTKPCAIEWKADSAAPWAVYKGESIPVTSTRSLFFRARDTCGNTMDAREESYEIRPEETSRFCPENMEYVKVGENRFCIDKYEWPNKKGAMPRSFISLYQAMDSCASAAGKHLCTSDEWTLACTGPYGWKYPYGAAYEPHACVTQDTSARPSGTKVECRGYFDVYDMGGNLAEWTNTKSNRNPQFYNVKGGFWESGPRSGCFDVRYSYYPQNRHNPVGFRCCKEALP